MTFALPPRLPLHISTTHTSSTLWQKLAFHLFTLIMFPSSSHHITSHLISFILQTVLLPPLLCLLLLLLFWYNSRDDVIIFRYSFSSFCMGFFHLYLIGAHVDSATMFNVVVVVRCSLPILHCFLALWCKLLYIFWEKNTHAKLSLSKHTTQTYTHLQNEIKFYIEHRRRLKKCVCDCPFRENM